MRTRHPVGCSCDQTWHHQPPAGQAFAACRHERERVNAARQVGKTMSNPARERRVRYADGAPP